MGAGRGGAVRTGIGRRSYLACAAIVGVLIVGMILWSSVASAALVHPFVGTVAKNKKGFSEEVCGVSVDPVGGEIFVSDPEPANVQVFDKTGAFLSARTISSVQIVEQESETEVKTREEKEQKEIEKGKTPKEVPGKFEREELEEFCSTAVNDTNGELYIADGGEHAIYPFDKEGNQVFKVDKEGKRVAGAEITGKQTPAGELGEELSIAIDQRSGRMYVADKENEAVDYFNEAGEYEGQLALPGSSEDERETAAVAVDQQTGEVYVAASGQAFDEAENDELGFVYVFDSSGKFLREISGQRDGSFAGFGVSPIFKGIAVGPEGNLYVSDATRDVVFEFTGSGSFIGEITGTPAGPFVEAAGIALNEAGDLYVIDTTEPLDNELALLGLSGRPGALDEFGPASLSGSPTIESESTSGITATEATLQAGVDPTGVETSYYFELCHEASCVDLPPAPGVGIGAGEAPLQVSRAATGLIANASYSFRVVLTYGSGGTSTVAGAVQTFTTRTEGTGVQLPDGRAWELVSSPEKDGAGLESIPLEGGLIESSEDGDALTFISLAPDEANPEGNRVPTFAQILAKRSRDEAGAPAWSSKDITLPGEGASGAVTGEGKQEYRAFTPDLELSLVEPLGLGVEPEPHLSVNSEGKFTDNERTIYTRKSEACAPPPSTCYTAIVNAADDAPGAREKFGGFGGKPGHKKGIQFVNATPDLSHVVFKSEVPLTEEPAFPGENLYEWSAGRLQLVNVLPEVKPPEELKPHGTEARPQLGTEFLSRNAISEDGSHVIFKAIVEDQNGTRGIHLYDRDMSTGVTEQVDVGAQGGEPFFQDASSDGSKIFFTDEAKLTASSSAMGGGQRSLVDLYEFDTETGKVTDLSVPPSFKEDGEHAAVQGIVPGTSADGSTVYFVANGVLTNSPNANGETAQPGHCLPRGEGEEARSGATCNLYVKHGGSESEPPTFVARLSQDDAPDWEYEDGGNLENVTDRVTPSGRYFAFMSARSLTGYDNRDTNPVAHEARDEEVFLYDDETGRLACASCDPQGGRPAGVFDGGSAVTSEEGIGLVIDRTQNWEGKWLAGNIPGWTGTEGQTATYQSRYLSEEGRLFFNTPEPLSQADTNGKADVYEYEPAGVGSCGTAGGCTSLISSGSATRESAFLDASASGDDVFFLSSSALVSTDIDQDSDVYDARVCGAEGCVVPPQPSPTSCHSIEGCRGGSIPPIPSFGSPASTTTPSSGNLSGQSGVLPSKTTQKPVAKKTTRAQQLAKALKSCKKLHKKKKRVACEASARKKYGAKRHAPAKKAKK
jgi:DNA-binding beta-propeller fold protein YncE